MSCKVCDPGRDGGKTFSSEPAFLAELSRVQAGIGAGRASIAESDPFALIFDCTTCSQRWELVFPDWPKEGWLRKIDTGAHRRDELRAKFRGEKAN